MHEAAAEGLSASGTLKEEEKEKEEREEEEREEDWLSLCARTRCGRGTFGTAFR